MKGDNPDCPCGSGLRYAACCRRWHRGDEPPDAITLMRSRFAAFAVGDPDYLWRTLHPDHPERASDRVKYTGDIRRARQSLKYARLRVLDHDGRDDEARVLFHAELYERGKDRSFLELSTFRRTAEGWRYLSGENRALRGDDPSIDALRIATAGL